MDASVKKMLKNLKELEFKKSVINRDIDAIKRTLAMLGLKVESGSLREAEYAAYQPFRETALNDACLTVLKDHKGAWLTRSQIEYLIARGGYESSTKDIGNSVDVTLRRLAGAGACEAERVRGSRGSRYRWMTMKQEKRECCRESAGHQNVGPNNQKARREAGLHQIRGGEMVCRGSLKPIRRGSEPRHLHRLEFAPSMAGTTSGA
jgi:hypothetical protein